MQCWHHSQLAAGASSADCNQNTHYAVHSCLQTVLQLLIQHSSRTCAPWGASVRACAPLRAPRSRRCAARCAPPAGSCGAPAGPADCRGRSPAGRSRQSHRPWGQQTPPRAAAARWGGPSGEPAGWVRSGGMQLCMCVFATIYMWSKVRCSHLLLPRECLLATQHCCHNTAQPPDTTYSTR
jgi:hypothetical protein